MVHRCLRLPFCSVGSVASVALCRVDECGICSAGSLNGVTKCTILWHTLPLAGDLIDSLNGVGDEALDQALDVAVW